MSTIDKSDVYVFCGPTISSTEVATIVAGAKIRPPVKHGDLLRLDCSAGDVIIIIDGVFFQTASVRHKEILDLLARDVIVVGTASMGALRAAELSHYGMKGLGAIFEEYRTGAIEADDEVAVAHDPIDYHSFTEALVDIRHIVRLARHAGALDDNEASSVMRYARGLHFTERTWVRINHVMVEDGFEHVATRLNGWRESMIGLEGAKHRDAREALELFGAGKLNVTVPHEWAHERWRTSFLRQWISRYNGITVEGRYVPFLALLQHQQLYDDDFSRRWRGHVLSRIMGMEEQSDPDERRVHAYVQAKGLGLSDLSQAQLAFWLTPREMASLADQEKLIRLLVRSRVMDATATIWPDSIERSGGLINSDPERLSLVANSFLYNDDITKNDPRVNVHNLRRDLIRRHLANEWATDPDDTDELNAAARDRGFGGIHGAVEADRSFFLFAHRAILRAPATRRE